MLERGVDNPPSRGMWTKLQRIFCETNSRAVGRRVIVFKKCYDKIIGDNLKKINL